MATDDKKNSEIDERFREVDPSPRASDELADPKVKGEVSDGGFDPDDPLGLGGVFADDDATETADAGPAERTAAEVDEMATGPGMEPAPPPIEQPAGYRHDVAPDSPPAPESSAPAGEPAPESPGGRPLERRPAPEAPEPAEPVAPDEPSFGAEAPRDNAESEDTLQVADAAAEDAPVNAEETAGTQVTVAASGDGGSSQSPGAPPAPATADDGRNAGGRSRWGRKKKILIAAGVLMALLLVGAAGIAYAGYDYTKKYDGRILPGAVVAGVDVGGMTPDQALAEVKEAVDPQLHRTIRVKFKGQSWTVTPKGLGAESNARSAVDAALDASEQMSFVDKTRMRVFGDELVFDKGVAISYPRRGARALIEKLAAKVNREPQDARLDYSTGWVEVVKEQPGRKVRIKKSLRRLKRALLGEESTARLVVRAREPKVTADAYDEVLLVRTGENKLYFYQNGKITHTYTVATGLPEYPTPTGLYEVTEKRYMPTWVNPAPDGWGAGMPAMIPPGPGNPLGLRAINWSASGIRFHGTTATYSLGHNASHGCVRLSNEDVIQLYDMVEVGTPIVSVQSGAYDPLYTSGSTDTPTAENSADAQ
jgi:lipoprotein-anchoring transpeptidase ErfK/SrfK